MSRKPRKRSYEQLNKTFGEYYRDDNYCVPLALSALSGLSAGKVASLCKSVGRSFGRGMKSTGVISAFEAAGMVLTPKSSALRFCTTLSELSPEKSYLLIIRSGNNAHAVAVRKGEIVDFTKPTSKAAVLEMYEVCGGVA